MMNKSRGFRGHRSPYSSTPPNGGAWRIRGVCFFRKHHRTRRYSDASVWVGKKHKPIVFLHKGVISRTHIRHNIPHIPHTHTPNLASLPTERRRLRVHTHANTPHTRTPHIQHTLTPHIGYPRVIVGAEQSQSGQSTASTYTQYNIPHTCILHTHSPQTGISKKAHTHTHHIRHTRTRHTHTRHAVSEGFAFTHPNLGAYKHTWGWFNKAQKPSSSTGVLHTTRSWFRQILPLQENDRTGAQVRQDRRLLDKSR